MRCNLTNCFIICTVRFLTNGARADTFVREMTLKDGPCWEAHLYGSRLAQFKAGNTVGAATRFTPGTSGNAATQFTPGTSGSAATQFTPGTSGNAATQWQSSLGGSFGEVGGSSVFESLRGLARDVGDVNVSSLSRALARARRATQDAGYVEFTAKARCFFWRQG